MIFFQVSNVLLAFPFAFQNQIYDADMHCKVDLSRTWANNLVAV